ncbi:HDOD domain-containing protein [Thiorhodococcus mannitoliphagus]|uniref:HDOD domain-containing protein n=1 Tax=Thiorhodococcus mannitoliphagus TaxID=329406 RepID=A0A6P1E1T2_9GAMM|nr:HDOD domain-containing protein [Thiorhodococcus mannitoliphagus]NEX21954.1 HDOD domain-containing protein [Thiorhodococcus mannitoliphagus]
MSIHKNDDARPPLASVGATAAKARIQRLSSLPPLPRRSQELLRLLTNPELNILDLVALIEQTPALAARILGVAASPFFRSPMPVRSISDAIIRLLGLNLVRDLSLSLILSQPFDVRSCRGFDVMRYWRHAMMTATFAQFLAPSVQAEDAPSPSEAYLGGLLHSLGLLALVHVAPDVMGLVFRELEAQPERHLAEVERELAGMDHVDAGIELARAWRLPSNVAAVMAYHREVDYRGDHWRLVAVVTLADAVGKDCLADALPADWGRAHWFLREALGVPPLAWDHLVECWQARSQDIADLAAVLAGSAS